MSHNLQMGKGLLRFGPDAVEEQVAGALGVGFGFGGGVEVHDLPVVLGAIGRPDGEVGGVGVAVAGEVGPVLLDLGGEGAVFGTDGGSLAGVEGAEDVFDVVGVEGAGVGVVEFVVGGGKVEAITVDGGFASFDLGFKPGPGGVGDEAVAEKVACGLDGFHVGGGRVEGQELAGVGAKLFLGQGGEAGGGGGDGIVKDGRSDFVGVPAGEEGDVCLLAGGEDGGHGLGEEVAIDVRAEAGRYGGGMGGGGFEDVVGGELSEVGEAGGVEGGLGEGGVFFFSFGEGGVAETAGVKGGSALTDSLGDEVFGEGRGHLRADGEGSGGLTEEGDVVGVAAEVGDVALDPLEGGGLVEETVVAGGVVWGFGGEGGRAKKPKIPSR